MESGDRALVETLGGAVLRPEVIDAVVNGLYAAVMLESKSDNTERLTGEVRDVEAQIERLTDAIASSGELVALVKFTPAEKGYRFEGEAAIGRLLEGVAGGASLMATPGRTRAELATTFSPEIGVLPPDDAVISCAPGSHGGSRISSPLTVVVVRWQRRSQAARGYLS